MKTCSRCKVCQPLENFAARKRGGLVSWCTPCRSQYNAQYRVTNGGRIKQQIRDWHASEHGKIKRKAYVQRNQSKVKAQKAADYIRHKEKRSRTSAKASDMGRHLLHDCYIRRCIYQSIPIKAKDIPQELVEAVRANILVKRLSKEARNRS